MTTGMGSKSFAVREVNGWNKLTEKAVEVGSVSKYEKGQKTHGRLRLGKTACE